MKRTGDRAVVVSVHYDGPNDRLHINLKWHGDHNISDFDLDRLGDVMHGETETEDSGWVSIEPYSKLSTYFAELQPPFLPLALEPSFPVAAGDTLPLRERRPVASKRATDFVRFWYCLMDCVKERRLLTVVKCLGRNTTAPVAEPSRPIRLQRAVV